MPRMPVDKRAAALNRQQARTVQSLVAAQEKLDDLEKMVARQTKARNRAIVRAADAGINHAEIGRVIGMSKGRVWQLIRDMAPAAGEAEADAEAEGGAE